MGPILFIFGVAIGSFINVLALRYEDGNPVVATKRVGGRSKCMSCEKVLCWYELIPVVSFAVQCGVCRGCKKPLRWQYPLVELITGILTATIVSFLWQRMGAIQIAGTHQGLVWVYVVIGLWLLATYTCITLSAIDFRLQLIPDQCSILLGIIGVALVAIRAAGLATYQSFLGSYATTFGGANSPIWSALIGATVGLVLFGGIVYLTKQRGMGLGDVKLAIPLGILLGWPDILITFVGAFIVGSAVGLLLIARRKKTMKAAVPFGPFLIIGLFIAMFYGETIVRWYFRLI